MTPNERNDLLTKYAEKTIEGMDFKELWLYAISEKISTYDCYSDEELIREIEDYYPELLELIPSFTDSPN